MAAVGVTADLRARGRARGPEMGKGDPSASEVLAEFACALSWDGLPPAARERAKALLLDHLGVGLLGASAESSQIAQLALLPTNSPGPATVFGRPDGYPAEWAALVNGTAAHATEMDDCVRSSSLHPGVAVIPAAIAMAEEAAADGVRLLEAIVAGYEITMRVGAGLNPPAAYERGFHPTGVAGVFGAATAAGLVMHLDRQRLVNTLGIAGTMASGSLEGLSDATWTKRLNPGWAAHAGLVAARLGALGYTGPRRVFEGSRGLLHSYTDHPQPELLTEQLGDQLMVLQVAIKPYGFCRYVHPLVDAALEIVRSNRVRAEDVNEVMLAVPTFARALVLDPISEKRNPKTATGAQFSAPYAVAEAITHGPPFLEDIREDHLGDAEVIRLMNASVPFHDSDVDAAYPRGMPGRVVLRLRDGRELSVTKLHPLGEPENFLTQEQLMSRFTHFAMRCLPRATAIDLADGVLALDVTRAWSQVQGLIRSVSDGGHQVATSGGNPPPGPM